MDSTDTSALPDPGTSVPYAQATPPQVAQALAYVRTALARHFPTLAATAWGDALRDLQPDLWVAGEQVYLDDEDLARLTQRLTAAPGFVALDPPLHNDQTRYLAKRLVNYQDQALHALQEIEAAPLAYGGSVLALVLELAAGNGIAQQVYRHTQPGPERGRPGRPDPAVARQAAGARIEAVRAARGELAYAGPAPAGPPDAG